ncbi:unnamed protein product [Urochloa humidicola]
MQAVGGAKGQVTTTSFSRRMSCSRSGLPKFYQAEEPRCQARRTLLAFVQEDHRRMEDAERTKRKRHMRVLMPQWVEYMNWLADQVGELHLETRRWDDVYEKALMRVCSQHEGYRDK